MRRIKPLLVLAALLAAPAAAQAQALSPAPPTEGDDPRFSYHRSEDGFLRLDLRTGQVSRCASRAGGWSCLETPDDRAAFEAEIGRLQRENAALKKALLDRGLPLPGAGGAPSAQAPALPKSPGDAEVDRVMGVFERIWRRLIELMATLQRDLDRT